MQVVVAPEGFHEFRWGKSMYGVVHRAVTDIAKQETREERKRAPAHKKIHAGEYDDSEYETGHRWHEQAFLIPGVFVVHAVHSIYDLLCTGALYIHMEKVAVHNIFEQGPEECSSEEQQ